MIVEIRGLLVVIIALGAVACGGKSGAYPSPMTLGISWDDLPPPGRCRAWVGGLPAAAQPLPQDCDSIEYSTPPGSRILYRPDDGTRRVVVCYLSPSETGRIIGVDVFDMDSQRLLEVLQSYGEDPPQGGCMAALFTLPAEAS
jgi:hypothetical protein